MNSNLISIFTYLHEKGNWVRSHLMSLHFTRNTIFTKEDYNKRGGEVVVVVWDVGGWEGFFFSFEFSSDMKQYLVKFKTKRYMLC